MFFGAKENSVCATVPEDIPFWAAATLLKSLSAIQPAFGSASGPLEDQRYVDGSAHALVPAMAAEPVPGPTAPVAARTAVSRRARACRPGPAGPTAACGCCRSCTKP